MQFIYFTSLDWNQIYIAFIRMIFKFFNENGINNENNNFIENSINEMKNIN